jgi:hypothetical protein
MLDFRETAHDDGTYGTARRRCLDLVISRGFIARVNIRTMLMPLIPDNAAFQKRLAALPLATYQAGETVRAAGDIS